MRDSPQELLINSDTERVQNMSIRSRYDHYVDGRFLAPTRRQYRDSLSPVSLKKVTEIADGDKQDVELAVSAANQAFPAWRDFKPMERGNVLAEIARRLRDRCEELAEIESAETGKPSVQTPGEVLGTAAYFDYYAGLATLTKGETVELGNDYHAYTRREPFGPVGVITPWNAPMNQAARSIAPALAVGNTIVAKPSEFTSATTVEMACVASEVGLPDGVLNVVLGDGPGVGAEIVQHPLIRKIAFTGSLRAGREIGRIAAERVIPVSLELGGKSPNIIFEDADLEEAVPGSVRAFVANTGQICMAGTRLLVQRTILDTVLQELHETVGEIQPGMHIGPIITEAQYEKVLDFLEIGKEEGVTTVVGGRPVAHPEQGYFVQPTVYAVKDVNSRLYKEEIFGPVLVVLPFDDEDQAISLANDTNYGLSAGLWTRDVSRAHRVARQLEAGQIYVNEWVMGGVEVPFGGYKESGIGREKGLEALHHYTQLKSVIMKL